MRTPYLVQRATQTTRENKEGIDSILSFDYMGSAEFEWGALPKSLQRMRKDKDLYVRTQLTLSHSGYSKSLDVWSKKEDVQKIHEWLQLVAKNKHPRCKEFIGLDQHFSKHELSRKGLEYRKEDFWWDIDNDFFFWFTNDSFTTKLLSYM